MFSQEKERKKKTNRRVEVINECCAGNPSTFKTRQFRFVPTSTREWWQIQNGFHKKKAFRLQRGWDYSHQGEQKANGKCKSNPIM